MDDPKNFLNKYQLDGEKLKVFTLPSPILKKVAVNVEDFNDELRNLVKNMLYTMYMAPGIGLAAPQIGVSKRIFVIDIDFEKEEITKADGSIENQLSSFNPKVFINPKIKEKKGVIDYEEGCLSVPGIYEKVKRAEEIEVEYFDMFGNQKLIKATNMLSVCIQHENDHLDGIVFLERLSLLKRNLLTKKYKKLHGSK